MRNLTLNGKKSYTHLGWYLKSAQWQPPQKKTHRESLPYRQGTIPAGATNGGPWFEDAGFTCTLAIAASSREALSAKERALTTWLYGQTGRIAISADTMPGWYFAGECVKVEFTEGSRVCEAKCEFECDPFLYASSQSQLAVSNVSGAVKYLPNDGVVAIYATAVCTAAATIVNGTTGMTYTYKAGTHTDLLLYAGQNKLTITSSGTVTITYRQQTV